MLIEGPFSIRPPHEVDDYGWLECDLRLTHWSGGVVESAAIYVDDSMNREDGFLRPVIRYVRWEQVADVRRALAGDITWPTAAVSLSHFDEATSKVDALIRDVQAMLRSLPFVVFGLTTDRSVPDVDMDPRGRVTVMSRNGVQRLEYHSALAESDGLFDTALNGVAMLRGLLRPIDLGGWRESYEYELTLPDLGASRWWDYRPPASGTQSA